ncbi:MAG: DNA polymerase III subunit gamma/tau [Desulfobacteraceae bacterium]|nr:DNA polymerase III subunit gamma/tau [Desulfobacteraceae bacterium]
MTYQVLARKWRPQLFQDVIGQEHITQTLMNAIKTDRLAHAYLFSGSRGIGKTSVARIFAKAINCDQGEPGIPCNRCPSCMEITAGSSIDVQEIDGASNRGIDEIRELRESIKYMPSSSRYRIYIIDEVHMLTLPAFNALLKTLEEPPSHVKFIFATTEAHKVPTTILSRCQRFEFKRIPLSQIISHLRKIAEDEGIEIGTPGLAIIAREAEGGMRDAESLMDQVISFSGQKVEEKDITDILGIIDRDIIFESSAAILEGAADRCLEVVEKIYNYGYDIKEFYRALMEQFRNLLISLIAPQKHLIDISENDREEIIRQAKIAGEEKLHLLLNFLISREEDLRFTSNPRLILETTMIKLCSLGDFLSFDDLLKKLTSLEKRLACSPVDDRQTDSERLSEPDAVWSQENRESEVKETAGHDQDDKSWGDFLAFLSTKSKAAYSILKEWQVLKLTGETLEIESRNQSFSSKYFDDKERYDQLVNYCREFFRKDLKVKISVNHHAPARAQKEPKEKVLRREVPKDSKLPKTAQEVLNLFEGQIMKKNPIRTGKNSSSNIDKKQEENR